LVPVPVEVTVTAYAPAGVPVAVIVFALFSLSHPTTVPNVISNTNPKTMPALRRRAFGALPASISPSSPMPPRLASRVIDPGVGPCRKEAADDAEAIVLIVITVLNGVSPFAITEAGLKVQAAPVGRLLQANVIVPV
jgi:hypothetical protein